MKRGEKRRSGRRRMPSVAIKISVIVVVAFAVANVGMAIAYHGRALPNDYIGQARVGGKSFASLESTTSTVILPPAITFSAGSVRAERTPAELGIGVNTSATVASLKNDWRTWLPALSLVTKRHTAIVFQIGANISGAAITLLASGLNQPPTAKHITFNGTTFAIADGQSGLEPKTAALLPAITAALEGGKSTVIVPATTVAAIKTTTDLNTPLQQLQKQLATQLSFVYNGQTIKPSKADAGSWFAPDGQTMSVSADKVNTYVASIGQQLGITVANQSDLATATAYALGKNQPLTFALVPQTSSTVVRTYCTAVRDVSTSVLGELTGKLAATYADTRGWNDGGRIAFRHVSNGCQYTVWMSASSDMTKFGAICDDYYNCQVGTNVIMNYDRWTSATPPWNTAGDNLEDYHTLMIDHETGHRLGFLDNPSCPGAGQPAPVMMQQSINLKGCVFNIWPRPAEFTQLNAMLGLGATASVQTKD